MMIRRPLLALILVSALSPAASYAWDYVGHRIVNEIALASLPADFPDFVRAPAAAERIAFLSGEPDRWRNVPDPIMRQSGGSWSDHFIDVEQISAAGLDPATLPSLRYDFIVKFAAGRAAHPGNFPAIDPAKNEDHTREWPGFAPWAITEYYAKVKSSFSYLKALEENGTPEEVANAKANAIYVMGVMGHYVGDLAQPLHTTDRHNGWVGDNPNGYTTKPGIHSWIDSGFMVKVGITGADVLPRAKPAKLVTVEPRSDHRDPVFVAVMDYLLVQHAKVELIYQLDRDGKLRADGGDTSEGRALIEQQLLNGGQMLGSLWLTAWRNAPPDTYLRGVLLQRKLAAGAK